MNGKKNQSLIYIGSTENEKYAYNFKTQEFYIDKNYKREKIFLVGLAVSGGFLGNFMYEICTASSFSFDPVKLLLFSTFLITALLVLILFLWLLIAERFINFKRYEKLEIEDIKGDVLTFLNQLVPGNGIVIAYVCFFVFSICCAPIIAFYYLKTLDLPLWLMFILLVILAVYSIFGIWYYRRLKKMRERVILQMENKLDRVC